MSKRTAFSYIEILIAGCIGIFMLVPLVGIYQQSQQQTQQSLDEIRATLLAREVVEQFQTMKYILSYDKLHHFSDHKQKSPYIDLTYIKKLSDSIYYDDSGECYVLHAFSKLHLTALPDNYRRVIKLYPMNQGTEKQYVPRGELKYFEVIVEWRTLNSTVYNRSVKLSSLLHEENIFPGI